MLPNFSQGNINTGSQTTRYSLSTASLDCLYQTQRQSNYQNTGVVRIQDDACANSDMTGPATSINTFYHIVITCDGTNGIWWAI